MRLNLSNLSYFCTLVLFGFFSACASVDRYDTGRAGMFDVFSGMRSAAGREKKLRETDGIRPEILEVTRSWRWPLESVTVTSEFGSRGGRLHEGVDLKASTGTPVKASHNGTVIYAGNRISGYGWMFVIKDQASGLMTVYAHNKKILVKRGQNVKMGQLVSYSGKSGRATGPHLHFELRKGVMALNPEDYFGLTQSERIAKRGPEKISKDDI